MGILAFLSNYVLQPHDMNTSLVLANDQAAIDGIRKSGAKQLILAPGNGYTGGHSWFQYTGNGNEPSASYLYKLNDPFKNTAIDIHEYLDYDFSGQHQVCSQPAPSNLAQLTGWLAQYNLKVRHLPLFLEQLPLTNALRNRPSYPNSAATTTPNAQTTSRKKSTTLNRILSILDGRHGRRARFGAYTRRVVRMDSIGAVWSRGVWRRMGDLRKSCREERRGEFVRKELEANLEWLCRLYDTVWVEIIRELIPLSGLKRRGISSTS